MHNNDIELKNLMCGRLEVRKDSIGDKYNVLTIAEKIDPSLTEEENKEKARKAFIDSLTHGKG